MHLFFVDDSLILFKATEGDIVRVKECLDTYELTSGHLINYEKYALSFTPNTGPDVVEMIKIVLTIYVVQGHDMYLSLSPFSLHSKKLQF